MTTETPEKPRDDDEAQPQQTEQTETTEKRKVETKQVTPNKTGDIRPNR